MEACGREYRRRRPEETALYRAVLEGWPEVLAEASEHGGLPKRVKEEVRRYLASGVLARGFAHVQCQSCHESMLVAFSCKGRLCPSCTARRSEETAAHCEEVLPQVPFRQWTLSLPRAWRWPVVKTRLLKTVERRLVKAVWRWQRQQAKRLGAAGTLRGGAVAFAQLFGSALQLTPHLHLLLPEGMWNSDVWVPLPPPEEADVVAILQRVLKQLARDVGDVAELWPEDGFEVLQAQGIQHRLPLDIAEPERLSRKRRLAVLEGFRLHADTAVHAADRQGLSHLCRYGSRGPVAEERLSRRDDGRYEYRTKRGPTLVLTAAQLVKRLLALVPPRGRHLTSFHGLFASACALRSRVVGRPAPPEKPAQVLSTLPSRTPDVPRRPRLDWATLLQRTFGADLWTCPCGGKRKVLAVITSRRTAEEVLQNMKMLPPKRPPALAQGPPQLKLAV